MKAGGVRKSAALGTAGLALALGACGLQSEKSDLARERGQEGVVSGQAITEWIATKSAQALSSQAKDELCVQLATRQGLEVDNLSNLGFYVLTSRNTDQKPLQLLKREGCIDSFGLSQEAGISEEDSPSGQAVTTWIAVISEGKDIDQCLEVARTFGLTVTSVAKNLGIVSFETGTTDQTPLMRLRRDGCISSFEREGEVTTQ